MRLIIVIAILSILSFIGYLMFDRIGNEIIISETIVYQKNYYPPRESEEWDFYEEEYIDVIIPERFELSLNKDGYFIANIIVGKATYQKVMVGEIIKLHYYTGRISEIVFVESYELGETK